MKNILICFIYLVVWVTGVKAENLDRFLRKYGAYVHTDITGIEGNDAYAIPFQDKEAVGGYAAHGPDSKHREYFNINYDEKTLTPGTYELYVRAKGKGNFRIEQRNQQMTLKYFKVFIESEDYQVYYLGKLQYEGTYQLRLVALYSDPGLYIDYIFFTPVGTYIQNSVPTVTKLNEWLEYGEEKTLVLSRSFVSPSLGVNGEPLYRTTEQRDRYYIDLGIWQRTEFKEYDIKSISWVHNELPPYLNPIPAGGGTYLQPRLVKFKVLLPNANVEQELPKDSKVLLKGLTTDGTEVPLIFEVKKDKNRIINIAFSLNMDLDIEKKVIYSILAYIKRTGKIIPEISCKAHTGYTSWAGTAWEGGPESDIKLYTYWTGSTIGQEATGQTQKLSSILFWSFFTRNGKPTFAGLNLTNDKPINLVTTTVLNKIIEADIVKPGGMFMLSTDGTIQSATYYCKIDTLVKTCSSREGQWIIESLDGNNWDHADIFRVSAESISEILFMRPVFWVEEELIHTFRINGDRLESVPITVDRNILIMNVEKGNYLVYYGKIQETNLRKFWDKFCVNRKDKKEIEELDISGFADYQDISNVQWLEF